MISRVLLSIILIAAFAVTPAVQAQSFFDKVRDFGLRLSHPELQQKRTKRTGKRSSDTKRTNVAARPAQPGVPPQPQQEEPVAAPGPTMANQTPMPAETSLSTPTASPAASIASSDPAVRRATAERDADLHRDVPYGVPVSNRPGFVTSPYAPRAGIVDVRGIPSGVEVKDPYTGKVFLTP
ncbi:MAG: hypothetical protein M3032_01050 [Verrucomicrobiota bacterium]|nr:hypothetical protein [Verrucomicrobiota bacterium]